MGRSVTARENPFPHASMSTSRNTLCRRHGHRATGTRALRIRSRRWLEGRSPAGDQPLERRPRRSAFGVVSADPMRSGRATARKRSRSVADVETGPRRIRQPSQQSAKDPRLVGQRDERGSSELRDAVVVVLGKVVQAHDRRGGMVRGDPRGARRDDEPGDLRPKRPGRRPSVALPAEPPVAAGIAQSVRQRAGGEGDLGGVAERPVFDHRHEIARPLRAQARIGESANELVPDGTWPVHLGTAFRHPPLQLFTQARVVAPEVPSHRLGVVEQGKLNGANCRRLRRRSHETGVRARPARIRAWSPRRCPKSGASSVERRAPRRRRCPSNTAEARSSERKLPSARCATRAATSSARFRARGQRRAIRSVRLHACR